MCGELPRANSAGITKFTTRNMVFCAAFNCSNSSKSAVSFFSFPLKDEKRCKEWVRRMKRKDFVPTAASRLCSDHFSPDSFTENLAVRATLGPEFKPGKCRLKPDAVPSIFNFEKNSLQPKVENENTSKRATNTECCRSAFAKRRKLEVRQPCNCKTLFS